MELSADAVFEAIGELFSDETSIAVSNLEVYTYYRPSKRIDLKIKQGDPIKEGTITHKALTGGQKVAEYIDRDLFGVPYYGMAVPLMRDGKTVGCVSAIFPALSSAMSVVTLKSKDGWVPVPFREVMYLEASDRKTNVVTEKLSGTHRNTLNEFDFLLPKDDFIRCHRSFIVNIRFIKEIFPDTHSTLLLVMKNGMKITVSQSYTSYFRKLLGF